MRYTQVVSGGNGGGPKQSDSGFNNIILLPQRKVSLINIFLMNCGVREDFLESLGLQRDPTSPS